MKDYPQHYFSFLTPRLIMFPECLPGKYTNGSRVDSLAAMTALIDLILHTVWNQIVRRYNLQKPRQFGFQYHIVELEQNHKRYSYLKRLLTLGLRQINIYSSN